MGKHKNKKHKKINQYSYDEYRFLNSVCNNCGLCGSRQQLATFCYDSMYTQNPVIFIDEVLPELIKLKGDWKIDGTYLDELERFIGIFCEANICNQPKEVIGDCSHMGECLNDFKEQIDANLSSLLVPTEQGDEDFFQHAMEGDPRKYFPMAQTSKSKKQLRKEARRLEQIKRHNTPKVKFPPKVKPVPTCLFFCRTPEKWVKEVNADSNIEQN